jgi:hypothetical protein
LEPGLVSPLLVDRALWIIRGSVASMNAGTRIGKAQYAFCNLVPDGLSPSPGWSSFALRIG